MFAKNFLYTNIIFLLMLFSIDTILHGTKQEFIPNKEFFNEGFAPDTLVKVTNGYTPIASLRERDEVISFDIKAQKETVGKVTHINPCVIYHVIIITLHDGSQLILAPSSQIYSTEKNQWLQLKEALDEIANDPTFDILSLTYEKLKEPLELIYITVEPHHNFFISKSNILVHNAIVTIPIVGYTAGQWMIGGVAASSFGPMALLGVAAGIACKWAVSKVIDKLNKHQHPCDQYPTEAALDQYMPVAQVIPQLTGQGATAENKESTFEVVDISENKASESISFEDPRKDKNKTCGGITQPPVEIEKKGCPTPSDNKPLINITPIDNAGIDEHPKGCIPDLPPNRLMHFKESNNDKKDEGPKSEFKPYNSSGCPASAPIGKKGIDNHFIMQNKEEIINGRTYCNHAIDRMQERGIPPSVVENTIKIGEASLNKVPTRTQYYDPDNNISVIVETSGEVVTVSYGKL